MSEDVNDAQIVERRIERLHEALTQVLFQNKMMLNWVNGAVITVDREGNVLTANETALHALNLSADDFIGRHCHTTMHHTTDDGGEYPWEFCPVFAAIEDGSSHHVDGDVFWKKDKSSFSADYIVSPIRDENNEISGATLIFRNLTEQRIQEAKRIHGMKLESIGELSAGIAHEINTPIQFIGSNVSFLKEAFDDLLELANRYGKLRDSVKGRQAFDDLLAQIAEQEEIVDLEYLQDEAPKAFEQTIHGVDRVTSLVLGLKGFAHVQDNEHKSSANLNEIIQNTLIVCTNAYKYVAELETELGELPLVKVFHGDIGQVILNLVVNAAHAIEDKKGTSSEMGRITVRSFQEGDQAVITVSDTGCGIPPGIRERIFDPFYTTKAVGRGSGQGLTISRTIINDKHGGDLSFESTVGQGSTFTIRLPIL
ncbi:MAG: ATP-binding protein [Desulfocapsaceae bacterium]|nr:ATP-binding protein [Desulfocapsaceae bacterium]